MCVSAVMESKGTASFYLSLTKFSMLIILLPNRLALMVSPDHHALHVVRENRSTALGKYSMTDLF